MEPMLDTTVYLLMRSNSGHTVFAKAAPKLILALLFLAAQLLAFLPMASSAEAGGCHCCCACCQSIDAGADSSADNTVRGKCGCKVDVSKPLLPPTGESLAPGGHSEQQGNSSASRLSELPAYADEHIGMTTRGRSPPNLRSVPLFILHASFLI